jgi:glycosyltransferase involved in cell wall biosynthesis
VTHSARSSPPRVLHVLWSLDIGGAERAVYLLVREQIKRRVQADILVASHAGHYGDLARDAGAAVHELRQRRALDLRRTRPAAALVRQYDVVHFHGREPFLMDVAHRQRKARLVYTHRGGVKSYSQAKRIRHRLVARSLRWFDVLSANTVHSARAAAEIFRIPQEAFQVVYNGIDFSLLEPTTTREKAFDRAGIPRDATVLGTCAKLLPLKRVDRLLHATAALSPDVHCLVVGDGPERRALERLAAHLDITQRVTFAGLQRAVGDYLQVMDVFALPSGADEGFGNSLVEAMSVGIPSIVFADGGGLLEHVADGRTGFVARDQADFDRKLAELTADRALRRKVGDAGQTSVRSKYTLERSIDGYFRLYADAGVRLNGDQFAPPVGSRAVEAL